MLSMSREGGVEGEPGSGTYTLEPAVSGRRTVERQPQFPISGTSLELVIMTKITVGLDEHNKVNGG